VLRGLAIANDASLKLAVAGDGPHRQALEEIARAGGIAGGTRFLGVVGREGLPDLYASADAFVMPSTTETQGLVLAEALAAGALVVAADAPQNRDVLGGAGILVRPDAEAFAQAFSGVPSLPNSAVAQAAKTAAQRFAGTRQIDRMLALYESLIRPARIA